MQNLNIFFWGGLAALSSLSASAAENLEEMVVTATRQPSAQQALLGNTGVVDEEALKRVAHTHISESIGRVAGAHVHRGNGQESLLAIRSPVLTGAGACGATLTAADGVPLRAAGFCNVNELFEANSEQAQRLEVIRGPATALYGSNAMHGMINVIMPTVAESAPQLRLEAGPHDYGRIGVSANYMQGEHGLSVLGNATHDGGYRDASGFDQQKLTVRHEFSGVGVEVVTQLDATNLNQETAGFVQGPNAYKDAALRDTNPNPEAFRDAEAWRLWSRWALQQDSGAQWLLTPYLRYTDMAFIQHFLPGKALEQNGQRSVGAQLSWFSAPGQDWQLTLGMDLEYTQGFLEEFQAQPTRGPGFLQATIPQGAHYDYDVDALMLAPYAQWVWQVDARWRLLAATSSLWRAILTKVVWASSTHPWIPLPR